MTIGYGEPERRRADDIAERAAQQVHKSRHKIGRSPGTCQPAAPQDRHVGNRVFRSGSHEYGDRSDDHQHKPHREGSARERLD